LNPKIPKTALQKRFSIHFLSLGEMKRENPEKEEQEEIV
jgi:hypothetical protein